MLIANTDSYPVHINKAWCKDCSICKEYCPRSVFSVNKKGQVDVTYPEKCNLCGICQLRCPDFAIVLEDDSDEE